MAKDYKGSMYIFTTSSGREYIYYKPYKGKRQASGLLNTARNRKIVEEKLRQLYLDFLQNSRSMPINNQNTKLSVKDAFEEFIKSKERETKTIKSYQYAYNKIIKENYYIDQTIITFSNNRHRNKYSIELDCKNFMQNESNLSPTSKNIILRSFQAFISFCAMEGYLPDLKVYKKYKDQNTKQKKVLPYSSNEIKLMSEYLENKDRDLYLYVKFLSLTGSRGKEALELKINDIDLDKRELKFPNKINKNRFDIIPITDEVYKIIVELIERIRNRDKRTDLLFKYGSNNLRNVSRNLMKVQKKLGIKKKGRLLHGFRKYFINRLFDAKIEGEELSIFDLQKLARHSNINVTVDHYREYKNKELKSKLEKIF